jgi:PTS system mannose-specific IID component
MLKVFMGSFFIQSAWNFERLQGLGFAAAISPALKEIFAGNDSSRVSALKRHLVYYNAHPYMASPILGAAINMEEKASRGECDPASSAKFKAMLMAPYGAIGDMFFWGAIRPLASCLGILSALLWGIWGPVIFLAVYNFFHLWMRWRGLKNGYKLGEGVVGYIKGLELPRRSVTARYISTAVLGAVSALFAWKMAPPLMGIGRDGYPGGVFIAALAVVIVATFFLNTLFKRGLSVSKLAYLVVVPLIMYGMLAY